MDEKHKLAVMEMKYLLSICGVTMMDGRRSKELA